MQTSKLPCLVFPDPMEDLPYDEKVISPVRSMAFNFRFNQVNPCLLGQFVVAQLAEWSLPIY